jgi:hypothetical protein
MGDSPIPDSVSADQLQRLLSRTLELPDSPVIPALDLGDGDQNPGGLCDLQVPIMQIIQRSANGTNLMQEFTAALYLLHSVSECLNRRQAQAKSNAEPFRQLSDRDRAEIIDVLDDYIRIHAAIVQLAERLHVAFMMGSSQETIQNIRERIGSDASLRDLRSHLMVGDGLLQSLGISRDEFTDYINKFDPST